MKLIVGLGNPGEKYKNTRHNAGFLALDYFIENYKLKIENSKNNFESVLYESLINDEKIILAKPQTFMNDSGKAVKAICEFYKIGIGNALLVIHDDVALPLGTIRSTASSSAAGHNGVQNIIDALGTQNFHRLRIGVESRSPDNLHPAEGEQNMKLPTEAFVLQNFMPEEIKKLQTIILPEVKLKIDGFLSAES